MTAAPRGLVAFGEGLLGAGVAEGAGDQVQADGAVGGQGRRAALATLPDHAVDGTPMPDVRGKVVMVSFISTWCFPCAADLPVMDKLQKDLRAKGYEVDPP